MIPMLITYLAIITVICILILFAASEEQSKDERDADQPFEDRFPGDGWQN